jgi:ATP-dependent exoDNAse (exonuclease V) alpha subunit
MTSPASPDPACRDGSSRKRHAARHRLQDGIDARTTELHDLLEQSIRRHPTLSAEQQAAVDGLLATNERFATLDGAAGTGKSTTCRELIARLKAAGHIVGMAAPTHAACRVLEASTGAEPRSALTVASLLGLRERKVEGVSTFVRDYSVKTKVNTADVWIVDEASMLHPELLQVFETEITLLQRVIFVGDAAQLPPVGYRDTSPALLQPVRFSLTKVHRNSGPILAAATAIREMGTGRPRFCQSEVQP